MLRIILILVIAISFTSVRAADNAFQGIDIQGLQEQLLPLLQQVQTKTETTTTTTVIEEEETEEGEICDINNPEHCKKGKTMKYKDLKPKQQELLDAAEKAMSNSYSPYSKFKVGAAVLTEDGTIIPGTNYENAAYGSTICAERVAIMAANARGYRKIKKIAVIGKGETNAPTISPCGSCRQVINESSDLSSQEVQVIMSNTEKDEIIIKGIKELLPMSFGPKNLS